MPVPRLDNRRARGCGRRRPGRRRAPARQRGVIMVFMVLALLVLAALVFYVVNVAAQVSQRIAAQQSADAAAHAGAGWAARTLNLVAMNNTASAQTIASIHVLDAMPLATRAALTEQAFFEERARAVRDGTLSVSPGTFRAEIVRQFDLLVEELELQGVMLREADQAFTAYDVRDLTHHTAPGGSRGRQWQALDAMADVSELAVGAMSASVHLNGMGAGLANLNAASAAEPAVALAPGGVETPLITRNQPGVTGRRARFSDFERPVRYGLIPAWADHDVVSRGPYDTVFGMRRTTASVVDADHAAAFGHTTFPPGEAVARVIAGGGAPFGSPGNIGGGGSGAPGGRRIPTRYQTTGPFDWQLTEVGNHASRWDFAGDTRRATLRRSRHHGWLSQMARVKLNYLWPLTGTPRYGATSSPGAATPDLQRFAVPDWDDALPAVVAYPAVTFSESGFYRLTFRSRYPRTSGQFMTPGTWYYGNERRSSGVPEQRSRVAIARTGNWWLPIAPPPPDSNEPPRFMRTPMEQAPQYPLNQFTSLGGNAWMIESTYQVAFDRDIGILPLYEDEDVIVPQTAYFITIVAYAGRNMNPISPQPFTLDNVPATVPTDPSVTAALADADLTPVIENPSAGFNPSDADAPAPVDLDHDQIDKSGSDTVVRAEIDRFLQERLTFFAAARSGGRSRIQADNTIGGAFDRYRLETHNWGVAQARVFNNHSFDLWTQTWQSRLEPVGDLQRWSNELAQGAVPPEAGMLLDPNDAADMAAYLMSIQPLADRVLAH